jgi:phosphate transport system substrate-binding protein
MYNPGSKIRLLAALLAILLLPSLSGCVRGDGPARVLSVSGSTTILPIAEVAAESFQTAHPGTRVLVSGVGSSAGIESVSQGSSDIGTSSRDLKPEEQKLGLVDTPIAYDAIAVIVNPDNPVRDLTMEQVRAIFEGRVRNWREVGGEDLPIGLVNRDEASGTREAFDKIVLKGSAFDPEAAVLPGTGQVRSVVAGARGAVGYISYGFVTPEVRALSIDGVAPSPESVASDDYPVSRVLHVLTKGEPKGLAKEYIDYVLSADIQTKVVADAGYIAISRKVR